MAKMGPRHDKATLRSTWVPYRRHHHGIYNIIMCIYVCRHQAGGCTQTTIDHAVDRVAVIVFFYYYYDCCSRPNTCSPHSFIQTLTTKIYNENKPFTGIFIAYAHAAWSHYYYLHSHRIDECKQDGRLCLLYACICVCLYDCVRADSRVRTSSTCNGNRIVGTSICLTRTRAPAHNHIIHTVSIEFPYARRWISWHAHVSCERNFAATASNDQD